MAGRQRAYWSLGLGRWWGIPVRLHLLFLLFAVLTIAFTMTVGDLLWAGLLMLGVLLASLMLHEAAHAVASIRLGGKMDRIVIGPLGGLSAPRVPDEPEVQLFVALAGPIVHLALVVAASAVLALRTQTHILGLLNAIEPGEALVSGSVMLVALKLTVWLNWILMLVNLLPAYPFDGGPALRAMLWPVLGRRTACVVTRRIAVAIALGLCIFAFLWQPVEPHPVLPHWMPLVMLSIFLMFSAQQDLIHERASGVDDLAGYHADAEGLDLLDELWHSDDDSDAVLVQHRDRQRRERQEQARRAQEEYEDARVDDILARLHGSSLDNLSREDREILERASQRYRNRRVDAGSQSSAAAGD